MTRLAAALAVAIVALPLAARAVTPEERLGDAALEARARALSQELRCVVCQNQTIDDSNAGLARDLRVLLRERLLAGDSDAEALAFMTARYGDFVLLRPPVRASTSLLWLTPLVAFMLGGLGLGLFFRRGRGATPDAAPLSPEEGQRLAQLLEGTVSR